MVRLAAGLDEQGRLDRAAMEAALDCLERFGQRLRDMKAESVRVVGTNTLRRAKRKGAFLDRARAALGHPIEIISGIEEARLIYLGVAQTMPSEPGRRLVVDIGGGSTEIIIGEGLHAKRLESLHMGCVSMSSRFFEDGEITEKRMKRARLAARLELEPVQAAFKDYGWDQAVGSSGTIRSVGESFALARGEASITSAAVESLIEHDGSRWTCVEAADSRAIAEERCPFFRAAWPSCRSVDDARHQEDARRPKARCAKACCTTWSAVLTNEDARVRSVRAMQGRYHVDIAQAERVEATALEFLQSNADRVGARRAIRRTGSVVGSAAARDRSGRFALALSEARRVSARARGYARVSRRKSRRFWRTSSARIGASFSSKQSAGPDSALAYQSGVSDRAAASCRATASRAQCAALPKIELAGEGTIARDAPFPRVGSTITRSQPRISNRKSNT